MLKRIFYRWERSLASVDNNRVVRPFEWGAEWLSGNGGAPHGDPETYVRDYVDRVMQDSSAWYDVGPAPSYGTAPLPADARPGERMITFPSAITTPHPENNTVYLRYFPAASNRRGNGEAGPRRAVVVMAQWNADEGGHVGVCRLMASLGISAVRLSLPYHDRRMPPELSRADYIVSSNVGRTLQVNRQAVLDARRAVAWLKQQGYDRVAVLGTSLGSCLALLTGTHEPMVDALVLNHVSSWFGDVIWEGLSTAHVRAGFDGRIDLPALRDLWRPISPKCYMHQVGNRPALFVYALYDLSFPLHLSKDIVAESRRWDVPTTVRVLPCGHYTTGIAPFKFIDGYYMAAFLRRNL
ncbi:MAG: dienelactone hydrolase family protein [Rhodospirillaceae bacterium]